MECAPCRLFHCATGVCLAWLQGQMCWNKSGTTDETISTSPITNRSLLVWKSTSELPLIKHGIFDRNMFYQWGIFQQTMFYMFYYRRVMGDMHVDCFVATLKENFCRPCQTGSHHSLTLISRSRTGWWYFQHEYVSGLFEVGFTGSIFANISKLCNILEMHWN